MAVPRPPVPPPAKPHDRPGAPPAAGPTRVGTQPEAPRSSPRGHGADLPQPNERDEAAGQVGHVGDPVIEQARRDIDRGLVDTDLRTTPGLDAPERERLVGAPPPPLADEHGIDGGRDGGSDAGSGSTGADADIGERPQAAPPGTDRQRASRRQP